MEIKRNPTRAVRIGSVTIGAGQPVAVQSMTATHTQDIDATVWLVNLLAKAGADVVRIAVDSKKDADILGGGASGCQRAVTLPDRLRLSRMACNDSLFESFNPQPKAQARCG